MKQFFEELFEYNHHFNQKLCDAFNEKAGKTSEKSLKLFNHILNAHQIWNNRIEPQQKAFGIWQLHSAGQFKDIDQINYEHSFQILNSFDLNKMIHYSNTKGQRFDNSLRNILFHVINHSTYHRAQIATEFRQNGSEPLASDYIHYKTVGVK